MNPFTAIFLVGLGFYACLALTWIADFFEFGDPVNQPTYYVESPKDLTQLGESLGLTFIKNTPHDDDNTNA